jgi:hypothetical protein
MFTVQNLAAQCGYDSIDEFLEEENSDTVCWGFCTLCGYADCEVEPDAQGYECPNCNEDTYSSVLVILGLI